jgi:hypothetical protein
MSAKVPTVALMCDGHPDEPACVMLPEDMWDVTCKGVQPLIRRADVIKWLRETAELYRPEPPFRASPRYRTLKEVAAALEES